MPVVAGLLKRPIEEKRVLIEIELVAKWNKFDPGLNESGLRRP
jgi:hypothetical protein